METHQALITQAYEAFNARAIDRVLSVMHPDVDWPRAWEGDYVKGHEQVREYWQRQWQEINPSVTPLSFREKEDGRVEVIVHQLVEDKQGNLFTDGMIKHVYTIEANKIMRMEIEPIG